MTLFVPCVSPYSLHVHVFASPSPQFPFAATRKWQVFGLTVSISSLPDLASDPQILESKSVYEVIFCQIRIWWVMSWDPPEAQPRLSGRESRRRVCPVNESTTCANPRNCIIVIADGGRRGARPRTSTLQDSADGSNWAAPMKLDDTYFLCYRWLRVQGSSKYGWMLLKISVLFSLTDLMPDYSWIL